MTKSESFNWHRTNRICNGIYDFGLLRDKPDVEEDQEKPKLFSIYFSRTVFVVGIIAGVTFMVCLVLADKYQKSINTPHQYASFIYEKGGEKFYLHRQEGYNLTFDELENSENDIFTSKKLQNISRNIPIDEINQLIPITTVLRPINVTERNNRAFSGKHHKYPNIPNLSELNKNVSGIRLADTAFRAPLNLAELLRRTEVHKAKNAKAENSDQEGQVGTTPETSTLHFAQLESYKHYYNTKNFRDILKYVNCPTVEECNPHNNVTNLEQPPLQQTEEFDGELGTEDAERDQAQTTMNSYSLNHQSINNPENTEENDLMYADDSSAPLYLPQFFPGNSQHPFLDQFYNYRALSPLDINDMDQSVGAVAEPLRMARFSNRFYPNQPEVPESARLFTDGLEPYLKPPTPPPTGISFTPSYTTAIFPGPNEGNVNTEEMKPETMIAENTEHHHGVHSKPISLMVEIYPANDYPPLPLYDNNQLQQPSYLHRQEDIQNNAANQVPNPAWLPWKLSPYQQNRMRLFVNLFPQLMPQTTSPN